MRLSESIVTLCLASCGVAAVAAQAPLGKEATELRAHLAVQALDRYLETWNARDPRLWATSLNFPHIRPGPGAFELANTPEQYAAGIDFKATLATGWHHSEWTTRRVLQVGADKVHVSGSWQRYTADDRPLTGSDITYIVTNDDGKWGVLSRFAAGPTGIAAADAAANGAAARTAVAQYFHAWNSHDAAALAGALHFPHVRIGDGAVAVWRTPAEFLAGAEPARQRTWFETRVDDAQVVQAAANGVNIAITYSRRDRSGAVLSQYEAVVLVVRRADGWRVQAVSTMGT